MTDPNDPGKPNENETPDPAPNPDPAPTPDPAPEPQPGDKGASSEEVQQALKALAEIHKKMAAGEAPRPGQTPEQIREQIRE